MIRKENSKHIYLVFEILIVVAMKNTVFWDVTPYSLVDFSEESDASIFKANYQTTRHHISEANILN
jgi:hypothetical protein